MAARRLLRATGGTALALAALALGPWASSALATFHLMSVREVYPGSASNPAAEYVELQMYADGQQFVAGHVIRAYSATGAVTGESAFSMDAAHGANQSTILMATPQAEAEFGMPADGALSPAGQLDPAGGAVCWEAIDCVSWGSFSGALPSPAGPPAVPAGIPDGMALRRSIAPNCPTLLEPTDDRDNSALDFQAVFPGPRPNSVPPAEHPCTAPRGEGTAGTPGGSQGGPAAPQTRIVSGPKRVTEDRTPTFRFRSGTPGATFLCKMDRQRFRRCHSPFTARPLKPGRHLFEVRARAPDGLTDPTPATYGFRVIR